MDMRDQREMVRPPWSVLGALVLSYGLMPYSQRMFLEVALISTDINSKNIHFIV
jgi:hypothetical protein